MRRIKLSEKEKAKMMEQFAARLDDIEALDDRLSFEIQLGKSGERCRILYTPEAWIKKEMLIKEFSSEVAWHGVVKRIGHHVYKVEDIVVYPQTVTGASVSMDETEYAKWIESGYCDDDSDWVCNLFMQGHSHVNMGVSPSGTDLDHQREILSQMTDDNFYVFSIENKRGESWYRVIDFKQNAVFENNDIDVQIIGMDQGFMYDAREMVKTYKAPAKAPAKVQSRSDDSGFHPYAMSLDDNPYTYYLNRMNMKGE